jgi:ribosomal protein S27AE
MKENNSFDDKYLKVKKLTCEKCGFCIPIPRNILSSKELKCPGCGAVYSVLLGGNVFSFIRLSKDNKY